MTIDYPNYVLKDWPIDRQYPMQWDEQKKKHYWSESWHGGKIVFSKVNTITQAWITVDILFHQPIVTLYSQGARLIESKLMIDVGQRFVERYIDSLIEMLESSESQIRAEALQRQASNPSTASPEAKKQP